MTEPPAALSSLFEWYRDRIGEPDREIDMYLGFSLFFGAIALGFIALLVITYSGQLERPALWAWRETGIALTMLGLPLFLLSVIVLLPADRRGLAGGALGGLIALVGVVRFLQTYPYQWDAGPVQNSISVILIYAVGTAILLASAGAALVAYQIARLQRPGPADIDPVEDAATTETEASYTDEEIQEDIDEAMADVDISWGGIEPTETTPLELNTEGLDVDSDPNDLQSQLDAVKSSGVDEQVAGLKSLKGGQSNKTKSETTVSGQADKLRELRERREQGEEPDITEEGTFTRLSRTVDGLFGK